MARKVALAGAVAVASCGAPAHQVHTVPTTSTVAPTTTTEAPTTTLPPETSVPPAPRATTSRPVARGASSPPDDLFARIRHCESGNDYGYRDGHYSGAYNFDRGTWQSTTGLPGEAADYDKDTQDAAAQRLYAQRGRTPWPVCGRR